MTIDPKHKHRPCPCGCGELADECMKPGGALNAFRITSTPVGGRVNLSDLHDGDRSITDPVVARLRAAVLIPHPLYEVPYADGYLADTTAGRVRSHGRRVAR